MEASWMDIGKSKYVGKPLLKPAGIMSCRTKIEIELIHSKNETKGERDK